MPQITLEYSSNLEKIDFSTFFQEVHHALGAITKVATCKSRAILLEDYFIGENADQAQVFLFLRVGLMAGRSLQEKQQVGTALEKLIKKYYLSQLTALKAADQARIEIYELSEPYILVKP